MTASIRIALIRLIEKAEEALDLAIRALKRHLGEEDGKTD